MNVLVSGGSGYIGAFVVQALLKKNHSVDIIARSKNEFTEHFKDQVTVYFCDITKPFFIKPNKSYDIFIHLAAANDIDSSDPAYAINASVLGTRYALDFCKKNNIKKFVYYSTFQVYGYVEGYMDENASLLPGNDYGITHQFAEQYIELYQRTSGIDFVIIRPTNIFGAPMFLSTDRWSLVPSCFCKEAYEKGEINLLSSGLQSRDFVDVNDMAGITTLYCEQFERYKNNIINVSSGYDYKIVDIAGMVKDEYKRQFDKPCEVNIHSELPKQTNIYQLSREKVNLTRFTFGGKEALEKEIIKIFKLLAHGSH